MFLVNTLLQLKRQERLLTLTIPPNCEKFKMKFESLQTRISKIAILDELLAGNPFIILSSNNVLNALNACM